MMKVCVKNKMSIYGLLFTGILAMAVILNTSQIYGATSGDYTYTLTSRGNAVFKGYSGTEAILEIPEKIDGYTVTEIGTACLEDNDIVTEVIIPDSVVTIQQQAFMWKTELKRVELGNNVKDISYQAFFGCTGLEAIEFPDTLTSIGTSAFYKCTSLKNIHLPKSVVSFGESYNQTGISKNVFSSCTGIESFSVEEGNPKTCSIDGILYKIDELGNPVGLLAYPPAKAQKRLEIPKGITEICAEACAEAGFEEVSLPKGLTVINFNAFGECDSLTKVTGGEGLISIESDAFFRCAALTTFDIPDSVRYIDERAFKLADKYTPNIPSDLVQDGQGNWLIYTTLYINGDEDYKDAFSCLQLVNKEREENGFDPLTMDASLLNEAMQRAAECAVCFDHHRPNGGRYTTVEDGVGPQITAENIAAGQNSAGSVMNSWLNSSGHRSNILSSKNASIGIGCFVHNGTKYWVQLFSTDAASDAAEKNSDKTTVEREISYDGTAGGVNPYIIPEEDITLNIGESKKLELVNDNIGWDIVRCTFTSKGIEWSSSDPETISVSSNGTITALKSGSAIVTAKAGRGLYLTKSIDSKVLVDIGKTTVDTIHNQIYTGKLIEPALKITYDGHPLSEGDDYTVQYKNNRYPGSATVTITGKGDYIGTVTKTFTISKANIANKTVKLSFTSCEYNGSARRPAVTISGFKEGTDFTVTYKNNTYPGTATAIITGKGNYTGTITKTFTIRQPSVASLKSVPVRLAKGDYDAIYASWSKVKASGATVKYIVQYKVGSGNWKTASKGTAKTEYTIKNLADGKKCYVRVTPYVTVNEKIYSGSSKSSAAIYTLKKLSKPSVKKSSKTKVKVSWKNISGESGYEVYKSAKRTKGFKLAKTVKSANAKSTTIKVKKNIKYYYKVRVYKNIKIGSKTYKVYGPWSSVKSYKLK